jgi:hypothetical protein
MIMMEIRGMRVRMNHKVMGMLMTMRLRNRFFMLMDMVFFMHVAMFVTEGLMPMLMLMMLSKNEPNAGEHERSCKHHGRYLPKQQFCQRCAYAEEGSGDKGCSDARSVNLKIAVCFQKAVALLPVLCNVSS